MPEVEAAEEPSNESPSPPHAVTILQPRKFTDQAADGIREMILTGAIRAGDRLNEVALSQMFGISRSPVREALNALASEKLVVFIPGRGAYVPEFDLDSVRQLGEARQSLECSAVRLVAMHASDAEINEMVELLHEEETLLERDASRFPVDLDLHQMILRSCKNEVIQELALSVNTRLRLARLASGQNPIRAREAHREHLGIVGALQRKDPEAAVAAMADHLDCASTSAQNAMACASAQGRRSLSQ